MLANVTVQLMLVPRDVPVSAAVVPDNVPFKLVPFVQLTASEQPACATVQVGSMHVPVSVHEPP